MNKPVTLAVVGAGMRGETYARFALENPGLAKVVAVAEPREFQRESLAKAHDIAASNVFCSWESFATAPRLADAMLIRTQDQMHLAPMLALAPKGYAVLMEKPMSPTLDDCERIVTCAKKHGNLFAVCHVLLYTEFTMRLKALLSTGLIGEIVTLQHLEPVGWWHQAHSFVRGNRQAPPTLSRPPRFFRCRRPNSLPGGGKSVLRNGFHCNGDPTNKGYSSMHYRPFTLEGNFLAMQALREMLLQSWSPTPGVRDSEVIRVFPAIPPQGRDASFTDLRAEGGHKVSARREGGATTLPHVVAGKDGVVRIRDNFGGRVPKWNRGGVKKLGENFEATLAKGRPLEAKLPREGER